MISAFGSEASRCTAMCGLPCGDTGTWKADASAAILLPSEIPPARTVSHWRISTADAVSRSRAPQRVNSFSPGGDGNVDSTPHLRTTREGVGFDGLFKPERIVLFDKATEPDGVVGV